MCMTTIVYQSYKCLADLLMAVSCLAKQKNQPHDLLVNYFPKRILVVLTRPENKIDCLRW